MIRLFTGFSIPADVSTLISQLRGGLSGARWIDEHDLHLTLNFLGKIEENMLLDVQYALDRVRRAPVEIILERLDSFGGRKPRAIVIVAKFTPSLLELQSSLDHALRRIGLAPEARKYIPHITIARLAATPSASIVEFLSSRGYFAPISFTCPEFKLFSSARSQGGGPYSVFAEYILRE